VIVQRGNLLPTYLLKAETATDARAHAHLQIERDAGRAVIRQIGSLVRKASIATAIPHDGEAT
jgi:hypothetical protein